MVAPPASPFARVRVLDLTEGVAGPYATRMLAGYGFDVVKVERPGIGDWSRAAGPFPDGGHDLEASGLYLYLNVGKRSVCLDWHTPAGRAALHRLAEEADVIVEDRGPGGLEALGLEYRRLAAARPSLVITSVSPFGLYGPKRDYRAPEIVLQALSGFLYRNGLPEEGPLKEWGYQAHFLGGTSAACGTLAALVGARLTGEGQHVDVSIQEAVLIFLGSTLLPWAFERKIVGRSPNTSVAAGALVPVADGEVMIAAGGAAQAWGRLVELVGDSRLTDERFATTLGRATHADELEAILIPWLLEHTREELYGLLQTNGVPAGYIRSPGEIVASPHHRARGFIREYPHPTLGTVSVPASPFVMEKIPWTGRPAPRLGEHTLEILAEIADRSSDRAADPRPHSPRVAERGQTAEILPLEGIRVLAPENSWAGPWCTKILGDLGAEVIKLESVHRYDPTRGPLTREDWRAYAERGSELPPTERADTFLKPNRNKLGITLDLRSAAGKRVFRRLAALSDVVVENFSATTMPELGLGYDDLKRENPRLIMLSMPLLGLGGPESNHRGVGTTAEALGGLAYLTGYEGGPPVRSGFYYGDPITGMHGAAAVLLALLHRAATGEGQRIDISHVEAVACFVGDALMRYVLRGENAQRIGNADETHAPHGVFRCAGHDRWIAIAVTSDDEWTALCTVLDDPVLLGAAELREAAGRRSQRALIDERVAAWTLTRDAHEATRLLQAAGVPAGTVATGQDLYEDDHLAARGFFEAVTHPVAGTHLYPGPGWKMSRTSQRSRRPAPLFGEHNDYVYRGLLGLSDGETATLTRERVIGDRPLVDLW